MTFEPRRFVEHVKPLAHPSFVAQSLTVLLVAVGLAACASPSGPAGPQVPSGSATMSDVCAGDSWLAPMLGPPRIGAAMSLDGMKRSRVFGPGTASLDRVQMDHLGELGSVRSSSGEVYEWEGPPSRSSSTGHETSRVLVIRKAFGDPRALVSDGAPLYGAPTTLANGVLEFPPTKTNLEAAFAPTGGTFVYTFADGTWVRVDGWMAQRFRPVFASAGPPPLPPSGASVAWEVCAAFDSKRSIDNAAWRTMPRRGVLRFFSGTTSGADGELVYRFDSPELASRAAAEQRARCSQPAYGPAGDKGLFSLTPPCSAIPGAALDGPLLRYPFRM
jgi:hypothetical protein